MNHLRFNEKPYVVCKDHTVSQEVFELRRDENFDVLKTFPNPPKEDLPLYYQSENYISHTDSKRNLFDKIYQIVKSHMVREKLRWIEKIQRKGTLLDIGAGTGDFLVEANKRGWKVFGSEPNPAARNLSAKKNIKLESDTQEFPDKSFDVITLWHVLEHVPDFDQQIIELDRLLKEDGLLVVALPNFQSYDAKHYKSNWAAYDVPRHLFHFSRNAVNKIFYGYDFHLVKEKGLLYDSFYVSLLSEKYAKGKGNLFKAFLVGLFSNFKAYWTGEFSSVVYFLKRTQ